MTTPQRYPLAPDRPTGSHEAMAQLTEAMRDAEAFFRGQS